MPQERNTAPASVNNATLKLLPRAPSTIPFLPETQPALACGAQRGFVPRRSAYAIRILGESNAGINGDAHGSKPPPDIFQAGQVVDQRRHLVQPFEILVH